MLKYIWLFSSLLLLAIPLAGMAATHWRTVFRFMIRRKDYKKVCPAHAWNNVKVGEVALLDSENCDVCKERKSC